MTPAERDEMRPKSARMTDAEFMAWCERAKPCRYCRAEFVGPACPCESNAAADAAEETDR